MIKIFPTIGLFRLCNKFTSKSCTKWRYIVLSPSNKVIPVAATFHTFPRLNAKLFADKENQYAHSILEKGVNYNISNRLELPEEIHEDITEKISLISNTADEVFTGLRDVVNYCNRTDTCISNDQFDNFADTFTNVCHKFTDEQLIDCLRLLEYFPPPASIYERNFIEIWSSLDDVCILRMDKWSYDKILLVCDCWYKLHLAKRCEFVWEALKKIGRKLRKLTPQQLVHTMFLCNIIRKPLIEMFDFELNFNNKIDFLNFEEIGVMCMGFFKTQTQIRNPDLLNKIYNNLINNLDTVEDITLVNYLKILRYSSKIPQADVMETLLENICPQIDRLSLLSCLHIALLGCEIQMCHDKSIYLILERFNKDINSARIKDMERICHVMGLFNIETPNKLEKELCSKIIARLHSRIDEIIRYPRCLPSCLHYLTLCGFHNEDLINGALEKQFLEHAYGKNLVLGREIFCLDSYARINLQTTYKGNLLEDKQRRTMGKLLTHYIPQRKSKFKLNVTDRILLEVKETCEDIYKHCHIMHILPHFQRPDIIIAYDKATQEALPASPNCPANYSGCVLRPRDIVDDRNELVTAAVIVGGWNQFVRNKTTPTGLLKLKLKQLEILGYSHILIPWYEWRELETQQDKNDFMRHKLAPIF